MSSRKTTEGTFDLVPVAIAAIGNQRTTCFPQIAHYTPAFVAAHRRRRLLTPAVRSSIKSQNWITHKPAALCSCHSLNPLHASVLKQGPSSSPDFFAEIPRAEAVVTTSLETRRLQTQRTGVFRHSLVPRYPICHV